MASRFALVLSLRAPLVYRAGPANPHVLQAMGSPLGPLMHGKLLHVQNRETARNREQVAYLPQALCR